MTTTPLRPPVTEPPGRSGHTRRTVLLVALAVLLVTVIGAAWWLTTPDPAPPPVEDPTAERRATDIKAAAGAFTTFLDYYSRANAQGSVDGIPLEQVATRTTIQEVKDEIASDVEAGLTSRGELDATVLDSSWSQLPSLTVTLEVCLDTSKSTLTFPDGRDARVAPDGSPDYNTIVPSTVILKHGSPGWLVDHMNTRHDQTC